MLEAKTILLNDLLLIVPKLIKLWCILSDYKTVFFCKFSFSNYLPSTIFNFCLPIFAFFQDRGVKEDELQSILNYLLTMHEVHDSLSVFTQCVSVPLCFTKLRGHISSSELLFLKNFVFLSQQTYQQDKFIFSVTSTVAMYPLYSSQLLPMHCCEVYHGSVFCNCRWYNC